MVLPTSEPYGVLAVRLQKMPVSLHRVVKSISLYPLISHVLNHWQVFAKLFVRHSSQRLEDHRALIASGTRATLIQTYSLIYYEFMLTVSGLQAHTSRCLRVSGNVRNGIRLYSRKGLRILPPKQVYNECCVL